MLPGSYHLNIIFKYLFYNIIFIQTIKNKNNLSVFQSSLERMRLTYKIIMLSNNLNSL